MSWNDAIKRYFRERRIMSMGELVREFGLSGPKADTVLEECLGLFQQEYGVAAGLLRPDDPLRIFTEPPKTSNPFSWYFTRSAYEDSTSELNYRLKKRLRASGRTLVATPTTVGEYVAAWAPESG